MDRITRNAICAAAALAGVAQPNRAHAADRALVDKLAPEIAKRCHPVAGGDHVITASDLGRAIYASKIAPLTAEYDWNRKGGREIARMAFANDSGENRSSLNMLQRLIQNWTDPAGAGAADYLPFAAGGVTVLAGDGGEADAQAGERVLAAILDSDDQAFRFLCPSGSAAGTPASGTEEGKPSSAPALVIAKAPDDLAKLKLSDRAYAELAYVNDREAKKESVSFYGTIGLVWPDLVARSEVGSLEKGSYTLRFAPTLFAQIERQGTDPTAEGYVDNLNFGLQVGGFFQTRSPLTPGRRSRTLTNYFAISARYLTDTHFASSGWAAAAKFTPGIPIPGNNVPYTIPGTPFQFRWRLTGVADHVSISDPGKKAELVGAPQYTRLGFDVGGALKYFLGEDRKQDISLGIDYSLRQRLGTGVGNAQELTTRFVIEPSPNFSFGLAYDRGENLDTLEHSDTFKLTFGVRR